MKTLLKVSLMAGALATAAAVAQNPEPRGWYAGDAHVHCDCGVAGGLTVTAEDVLEAMNTNDLAVVALLADMGNGEVRDAAKDLPRIQGSDYPASTPGRILHWDAEWHFDPRGVTFSQRAIGGHLVLLGLDHAEKAFAEYTYPILKWAREQHAVTGLAHMQYLKGDMPRELDCCAPLEYPVEVALGTVDFLMEDVDGGDSTILAYYRLLNCGFRPGLVAATDFPCNRREPIGSLLTYVSIPGGNLSYRGWIAGVAAGRTVVSRHAHREFLDLKVNGAVSPGDEVQLAAAGPVKVDVRWLAAEKLDGRLELVRNGAVVASQKTSAAPGAPGALALELEFRKSGWIAARRMDAHGHQLQTGAVFVTVKGRPVRANADDAGYFVHFIDHLLAQTASARSWGVYLPHDRDAARQRYRQAREIYRRIAREAHKEAQP